MVTVARLIERLSPLEVSAEHEQTLSCMHYDSRRIESGWAFFALRGEKVDGHDYIAQALENGASVVVMEEPRPLPNGVVGLVVQNSRMALAQAAALVYDEPTAEIPVVGVTGTNGKTTITYLVEALMREGGRCPAVLGTINYRFGEELHPSQHTTPEAPELLGRLADFRTRGCDALVMEVSSHALAQYRVDGVDFNVAVFTNLTPEHLDYHRDMDDYFASKVRLFDELLAKHTGHAVINLDDAYGAKLAARTPGAITYGMEEGAKVHPQEMQLGLNGIIGTIATPAGPVAINSPLVGSFNLSNLLAAVATGIALGYTPTLITAGLLNAPQVPGRMERVDNEREALILVDYAHTGDALEKVVDASRELQPRRLITVFGCGGDRDRSKRPVMGRVAAAQSDLVVVTSDNPRSEDPDAIIDDILPGLQEHFSAGMTPDEAKAGSASGYCVIPDRREAIRFAVSLLRKDDLLLVAGKGHEDYQIIGNERSHFDDREEIRKALAESGYL
ncbi:MAG: UDP-N-acetylmuramoyl-L-alanyl-D-glutamate--2,6-diaminopimelate ligase [Desulfuromonas sp.]|nr:MAG: UDP-N-acetylmuramoyl-L-alanyl-D-glutamate--2,6-diaminopimelate ligase [Desulfuromonas sp.]